ncbi:hypothetical protein [Photobacterium phosphoreum]|uniref:hypothetical protein n=1 Tax=Photobacterium phosphoreum TaxID=659 RepID=UPI000D16343A|nr:hypothetical protein [Photobacterium phosphoreum]MCD9480549.1 hypothetical protein [Photobacterium phosphoreum]MCD9485093.1 hypothetical protein [Photobacterium phosphoreum]PSU56737.1 hypothetical protein CTM80_18805 [Photobacterium phosphoreum]
MNVLLITPFYNDNAEISRPGFVREVLVKNNINVDIVTSDFSHPQKTKVKFDSDKIKTIKTLSYNNNTSIFRFISHFLLALSLFYYGFKNRNKYDIFYVTAPFAIVVLLLKIFTSNKIIVDIIDFWPDSLPFPKNKLLAIVLSCWSKINRMSINLADSAISLSTTFLKEANKIKNKKQILLGSKSRFKSLDNNHNSEYDLRIVYIGNIGLLYDFDTLLDAIVDSRLKIHVNIVGDGDKRHSVIERLEKGNISYTYYGIIYNDDKLDNIILESDFGFNGFINTTASFSYKAISYFKYGLPIINSMKGDLWDYVEEYEIGYNYTGGDKKQLATVLSSCSLSLTDNVQSFFNENLEYEIVSKKILQTFLELS